MTNSTAEQGFYVLPDKLKDEDQPKPLNLKPPCEHYVPDAVCYECGTVLCKKRKCRNKENCSAGYNCEHVPPKGLFNQNKGYGNIKGVPPLPEVSVPACRRCNNRFSLADEDFIFFVTLMSTDNPVAFYAMRKKRFRQILKDRPLEKDIRQGMSDDRMLYASTGENLGPVCSVHVSDPRHDRFFYVFRKIIRGLYYWHLKRPLKAKIEFLWSNKCFNPFKKEKDKLHVVLPVPEVQAILNEMMKGNRVLEKKDGTIRIFERTIEPGVFHYAFVDITPKEGTTIPSLIYFFMSFYGRTQFIFMGKKEE